MNKKPSKNQQSAQEQFYGFEDHFKSAVLSTVDHDRLPHASYAPFVIDAQKNFYFYISEITQHTKNLLDNGLLSILLVEDESATAQVFARRRLSYQATAVCLDRESEEWIQAFKSFKQRFGNIIDRFRDMSDFKIFKCTPHKGRFVIGFGAAYNINKNDLNKLVQIEGSSTGHGHSSVRQQEPINDEVIQRICKHMNKEHTSSLLAYANYFGKRKDALSAQLFSFNQQQMQLEIKTENGLEMINIDFIRHVETAKDAHDVLVEMSMTAK